MKAVYERELRSYFNNMTGYIFIAFMLLFAGIFMTVLNLKNGYPNFEYALSNMTFIYLIIIPVLTMRAIAEERRQRTDQLLYSLPMGMTNVVLGKYFAMLTVLAVPVVIMALYPLLLGMYGTVQYQSAYAALLGYFFMGAGLIAVGLFISSVTDNQAIAAVITLIVLLVNYYLPTLTYYVTTSTGAAIVIFTVIAVLVGIITGVMTKNAVFAVVIGSVCEIGAIIFTVLSQTAAQSLIPKLMGNISLFARYNSFVNGIFDLNAIVFIFDGSAVTV